MRTAICLAMYFLSACIAVSGSAKPPEGGTTSVRALSLHPGDYPAEAAFDGDPNTRWASRSFAGKDEWLQIDLGTSIAVPSLVIRWEAAFADDYEIQLSDDARTWQTVHRQTTGKGGKETIKGLTGTGRYLRILCHKAAAHNLASIWEVEFPDGPAAKLIADIRRDAQATARHVLADATAKAGVEEIVFAARNMSETTATGTPTSATTPTTPDAQGLAARAASSTG